MVALLNSLAPNEILFVDEIHRLAPAVAEVLYPAMEDHHLDIMVGEKLGAHTLRIDLPPFTLIGATTRADLLTGPLRDRFPLVHQLEFYSAREIERVLVRAAQVLDTPLRPDAARELATRARGTPRVANNLLRRVRDYAEVRGTGVVDRNAALALLRIAEVDREGLDRFDRRILDSLLDNFRGGPVGVANLAATLGMDTRTLEEVHEPYPHLPRLPAAHRQGPGDHGARPPPPGPPIRGRSLRREVLPAGEALKAGAKPPHPPEEPVRTADFDYELPPDRIAQRPPPRRTGSRLLHLPADGPPRHLGFADLPGLLRAGDLLVRNVTRVIPARLEARREAPGSGRVELLILPPEPLAPEPAGGAGRRSFSALTRPALPPGRRLRIAAEPPLRLEVGEPLGGGRRRVRILEGAADALELAERAGRTPLPPYIRRAPERADRERYQTVYARTPRLGRPPPPPGSTSTGSCSPSWSAGAWKSPTWCSTLAMPPSSRSGARTRAAMRWARRATRCRKPPGARCARRWPGAAGSWR